MNVIRKTFRKLRRLTLCDLGIHTSKAEIKIHSPSVYLYKKYYCMKCGRYWLHDFLGFMGPRKEKDNG